MIDDTIAAISTAIGEAALAVVRISGPAALDIADRCFLPAGTRPILPSAAPSHTVHYGHISHGGRIIDEVLLTILRAPRTFTREHMIEIGCHGGMLTTKLILDAILAQGARLADPGEFTKRAFLNGRIDLTQAEAVADLIHARTELALTAANEQLAGKLARRIELLRQDLMQSLAHIEAHIDFPDEDIAPDTKDQLLARIHNAKEQIEALLQTAPEGQILRRGIRAAIIGRPNAGKSSLMNQLLGRDRAIVSPIPGTTRDTLEETANVRGLPVVFTDTAGLRQTTDAVEVEGVRRSRAVLTSAELILHVLDASEPLHPEDLDHLDQVQDKKPLILLNKADLPRQLVLPPPLASDAIPVSCLTGAGLESLKDQIKERFWSGQFRADMLEVMINSRHQAALERARDGLSRAADAFSAGLSLELAALDLRAAVNAVGEVVGQTSTEDLLDSIFSQFCIGK